MFVGMSLSWTQFRLPCLVFVWRVRSLENQAQEYPTRPPFVPSVWKGRGDDMFFCFVFFKRAQKGFGHPSGKANQPNGGALDIPLFDPSRFQRQFVGFMLAPESRTWPKNI